MLPWDQLNFMSNYQIGPSTLLVEDFSFLEEFETSEHGEESQTKERKKEKRKITRLRPRRCGNLGRRGQVQEQ